MAKQKYWNGSAWEIVGTDADKVALKDNNNLFTSNNVEGALAELFTNAEEKQDEIIRVQRGSFLVNAETTAVDVTISQVDPSKSIILTQGTIATGATSASVLAKMFMGGEFKDSTTLTLKKPSGDSTGGNAVIYWQVIEFI